MIVRITFGVPQGHFLSSPWHYSLEASSPDEAEAWGHEYVGKTPLPYVVEVLGQ